MKGVMVRLLLVLAPAVAIVGGIGASYLIRSFTSAIRTALVTQRTDSKKAIHFYLPTIIIIIIIIIIEEEEQKAIFV